MGDGVRRFEGRDDALEPGERLECLERLGIRRVAVFGPAALVRIDP